MNESNLQIIKDKNDNPVGVASHNRLLGIKKRDTQEVVPVIATLRDEKNSFHLIQLF